ncbi:J domain-containing protein [Treponema brennaborense]|uniref:Heat shock protein DnaJ domain protein n=1 Tax=Treponema brennaborense (strain DSM 12168 / CIP 105900 / DD5/3) TaxID=906968 RepID=F4LL80_TREBD|nr:DnaJ domain-containing protein [Treponema brennaborense]AEE17654.1 heat shock protein DnaJ domain protein [Treponema brennaborense DSM 12168]
MRKFPLQKYACRVVFGLVGLLAGWGGAAAGLAIGWAADIIVDRVREDVRRKKAADNPTSRGSGSRDAVSGITEPFCGAELVCALAVYCVSDAQIAAEQLRACFGIIGGADWFSLCRPASEAESLNGDLLTECLAALIKQNESAVPVERVFTLLAALEFGWNEAERGRKPSAYLAELLGRRTVSNEIAAAYLILDIPSAASDADVKAAHRRLVSLYHPDTLACLPERQQEIARSAFIRIQHAYETVAAARGW